MPTSNRLTLMLTTCSHPGTQGAAVEFPRLPPHALSTAPGANPDALGELWGSIARGLSKRPADRPSSAELLRYLSERDLGNPKLR